VKETKRVRNSRFSETAEAELEFVANLINESVLLNQNARSNASLPKSLENVNSQKAILEEMKSNSTSQEYKKQKIASGSILNPSTGPIPREKGTIFSQIPKFIGEKKTSMQVTPVVPISVLLT
jgi:hypothetical protein